MKVAGPRAFAALRGLLGGPSAAADVPLDELAAAAVGAGLVRMACRAEPALEPLLVAEIERRQAQVR